LPSLSRVFLQLLIPSNESNVLLREVEIPSLRQIDGEQNGEHTTVIAVALLGARDTRNIPTHFRAKQAVHNRKQVLVEVTRITGPCAGVHHVNDFRLDINATAIPVEILDIAWYNDAIPILKVDSPKPTLHSIKATILQDREKICAEEQ
jgi:hypothetical protein